MIDTYQINNYCTIVYEYIGQQKMLCCSVRFTGVLICVSFRDWNVLIIVPVISVYVYIYVFI